jgi:hypothetical protein
MLSRSKHINWKLHKMEMILKLRKNPKYCNSLVSTRLWQMKLEFGETLNPKANLDNDLLKKWMKKWIGWN